MATETVELMTEGGIAGVGLGGEVELTVRAGDRFRERRTYKVEEERRECLGPKVLVTYVLRLQRRDFLEPKEDGFVGTGWSPVSTDPAAR